MKSYLSAALLAALILGGCAPQTPPPGSAVVAADDQPDATPKKKKCANQVGSRLAPCGEGSTGDYVTGTSGDSYRQDMASKWSKGATQPQ